MFHIHTAPYTHSLRRILRNKVGRDESPTLHLVRAQCKPQSISPTCWDPHGEVLPLWGSRWSRQIRGLFSQPESNGQGRRELTCASMATSCSLGSRFPSFTFSWSLLDEKHRQGRMSFTAILWWELEKLAVSVGHFHYHNRKTMQFLWCPKCHVMPALQ